MEDLIIGLIAGWLAGHFVRGTGFGLVADIQYAEGKKADAFAPVPAGIRPEWDFLAMFQTLKLIPSHVLGLEGEMLGVLGFNFGVRYLGPLNTMLMLNLVKPRFFNISATNAAHSCIPRFCAPTDGWATSRRHCFATRAMSACSRSRELFATCSKPA